jgi:hypothetical protein
VQQKPTFANKCLMSSFVLLFTVMSCVMPIAGCGKTQQVLQTVLAKEPSVIALINGALDLVRLIDPKAEDPNLKVTVDAIAKEATDDVSKLLDVIRTYQADLGSTPADKLAQARALYVAIDKNLAALTAAFHLKSDRAQVEVAAIVDFVDLFLAELANFLPPAAAKQVSAGVQAQAALKTSGVLSGQKVKIITAHDFAKNFNKASAANFPQIQIAVPK